MRVGTHGMMQVDYEQRIDFDRMREYRVGRIKKYMEEFEIECLLLFESGNKRYSTSTAVASPEVDMNLLLTVLATVLIGGTAMTGVAATQLGVAQASIAKLVAESVSVARSMQTPLGRYGDAAEQNILDAAGEFGCGEPFGDERRTGQLPTRTDPKESFELPEPPPVVYPPATPYESPRPR